MFTYHFRDFSLYVKLRRHVYLVRHVFAVLLSLPYALGEKIFDLPVYAPEIVLCPRSECIVKLCGKTERQLFFSVIAHISKGCPNLLRAVRRGCRKERREGWKP